MPPQYTSPFKPAILTGAPVLTLFKPHFRPVLAPFWPVFMEQAPVEQPIYGKFF